MRYYNIHVIIPRYTAIIARRCDSAVIRLYYILYECNIIRPWRERTRIAKSFQQLSVGTHYRRLGDFENGIVSGEKKKKMKNLSISKRSTIFVFRIHFIEKQKKNRSYRQVYRTNVLCGKAFSKPYHFIGIGFVRRPKTKRIAEIVTNTDRMLNDKIRRFPIVPRGTNDRTV